MRRTARKAGRSWLLVAAVPVTGLIQGMILSYTAAWSGVLIPIVLAGTLIVTLVPVHLKIRRLTGTGHVAKAVVVTGIALLFVSPFVWSCTPMVYGESGLPVAGPQNAQDNGNTGMGMETGGGAFGLQNGTSKLAEYLTTHRVNETWIVAVPSAMNGASLILETGDPVMALGGFSGYRPDPFRRKTQRTHPGRKSAVFPHIFCYRGWRRVFRKQRDIYLGPKHLHGSPGYGV